MGALMIKKQAGGHTIYPIHVCRFLQNARIWSFSYGKNQRFCSRWLNDSLQTLCLGALVIDVLIYAEKIKNETDLRKMIKIMEELLKIKKTIGIASHMRSHPKKRTKLNTIFNEFWSFLFLCTYLVRVILQSDTRKIE